MSLSPSEPGAKELLSVVARKLKSKKSDAEATQNALLAELEEEAERAAKKKEKKKRQKQKKKQQKNKGKADEAAAELERAAAQAAAEKAAALAKAEERRLAAEAAEEEAAKAAAEAADSSDELDSRHGQTKVDQEGQKPQSGNHAAHSSKGKMKAKQQGNKGNAKGAAGVGVESSKSKSKSASAGKSEVHRSESDSDSDTEGGAISGHVEQHGGHQKKGRPKTVQEAMTAGGFDRLKRSGGWQNDICGPQPLLTITDQVRKAGSGGLRLVTLAEELKKKWGSTSVNVGALGCYARHYDSSFELFDSDQSVAKGVPSSMKSFGATSVVRLKGTTTGAAQAAGKSHEATTKGDDAEIVSEEQAVQLLVDHIVNRSRCANVCCDRCRAESRALYYHLIFMVYISTQGW
eukprot:COSAG01_NODE_34_length_34978_cov_45.798475_13_plen_405_part_00